jgi:hypothetical protein
MSNSPNTSNINIYEGDFNQAAVKFAFFESAKNGQCKALQKLIETWGSMEQFAIIINDGDESNGSTPLMYACDGGHPECVNVLINAKGIDVNKTDYYGRTALFWAVQKGKIECVKALLGVSGINLDLGFTTYQNCSIENDTATVTAEKCKQFARRDFPIGITPLGLAEMNVKNGRPGYVEIVAAIKAKSSTGKGVLGLGFLGLGGGKSKSKYRRRKTKRSKKTRKGRSRKH